MIDSLVANCLRAQKGQEDAAALWKKIWSAYERGGRAAVEDLVNGLLEQPDDDEQDGEGEA